jgi:hypothetical protein
MAFSQTMCCSADVLNWCRVKALSKKEMKYFYIILSGVLKRKDVGLCH